MALEHKENKTDSLSILLDEINSTIFSKEAWVDNEFYKIPEITYSYLKLDGGFIVNKTLFVDLGKMDIETFKNSDLEGKKIIIKEVSKNLQEKINTQIKSIEQYIAKLNEVSSSNDEVLNARKEVILGGLQENILYLKLALKGLIFEEEKAINGVYFKNKNNDPEFFISPEERKQLLSEINNINTKIFGEKISNNSEYIKGVLDYLKDKKESYKKQLKAGNLSKQRILTDKEEKRYNYYLSKIQQKVPDYIPKVRSKPKSVIDTKWLEIKLHRDGVRNVLNHSFIAIDKQTGNMQNRAYFDKNVSAFTDTANGVAIPLNEKNEYKTIYDTLRLTLHEIEKHQVSEVAQQTLVGNIKGAGYLESEEGMAMLSEELFKYGENLLTTATNKKGEQVQIIDIEKISYVQSFAKTMMEEVLSDEEFYDFLYLQNKIEPDKMTVLDRYLRFKRTGFQRKDITYTTGKIKAAQYINSILLGERKGDLSFLYSGKIGFKDLDKVAVLKQNAAENNVKLPENLLFADAVYFASIQKEKGEKITKEAFISYVTHKYPFLKNLINSKIEDISYSFKKQLLGALDNIYTEIEIHNISKHLRNKTRNKSKRILD